MPLPERPHLYLEEAREQLGLKPYDFWYYLGQGLLKAEVWVEHRCQYVERFDLDDAPKSWETLFTSFYAGYLMCRLFSVMHWPQAYPLLFHAFMTVIQIVCAFLAVTMKVRKCKHPSPSIVTRC